jgi:SPP1 family predicted phage head-tail adaptor
MILSGNLRNKIIFKQKVEDKNDFAETTETLTALFTVMCQVLDIGASKGIISDGQDIQKTISISLRYSSRINEELVFEYKGVDYEITSIDNPGGLNKELIIDGVKYV